MKAIKVQLRAPTPRGEMYPRYDEEADILEVRSKVPREWPYGIDIDGTIIFDIDADRALANLDLLIPKRYWEPAPLAKRPQVSRAGTLVFVQETLDHKSFHLPLEVTTDASRSYAHIQFGTLGSKVECVALSQSFLAYVDDNQLVGFFVMLN